MTTLRHSSQTVGQKSRPRALPAHATILVMSALLEACDGKSDGKKLGDAGSDMRGDGSAVEPGDGGTGSGSDSGQQEDGGHSSVGGGPTVHGVYDVKTALPALPHLENVLGVVGPDSVTISFLPVDDAPDYRVYVLPADKDLQVEGDHVYVQNAVYRCGGNREVVNVDFDGSPAGSSAGARTLVDGQSVGGYTRSLAEANLGYVYYAPGAGRSPVYALGDPDGKADNWAFTARVQASRTKQYTTSDAVRKERLAKGWRDDGVVFYVPTRASAETATLYTALDADGHSRYYFGEGAEKNMRSEPEAAFQVLKQKAAETAPLYRVFYLPYQAFGHDELVYGKTMFERVRYQGSDKPMTELVWTGITGPTTLVVEALDSGCPYPGRLAAASIPAAHVGGSATITGFVDYPEAITPAQAQAKAPHGELFLNGQFDTATAPRATARAFLHVEPQKPETYDWFAGFEAGTRPATLKEVPCGTPSGNCFQQWRQVSSDFDIHWHTIVTDQRALGYEFGELWVRYADFAADTNGKFRLTPTTKGKVTADSYLHATMEVTAITTGRRYPQILISDRDAPIQDFLDQGNTVVVEAFRNWPNYLELQICDHRTWDVNNQCPFFQFLERKNPAGETTSFAPVAELGEQTAVDRRTRFDLFLSTKRAYILVDGKAHGCVDLPVAGIPQGDVTVTFGDVLYHSDADFPLGFHEKYLHYDTERRFDNLGFSSGVPAPEWDEQRVPCVPASSIGVHP